MAAVVGEVATRFMVEWARGAAGAEVWPVGDGWAVCCPPRPELDFLNKVYGAVPDAVALARYAAAGVRPWVELPDGVAVPGATPEERLALLAAPTPTIGTSLRAAAQEGSEPRVEVVMGAEAAAFGEVLLAGHDVPRQAWESALADQRHWADVPHWRRYLAYVDGEPAGAAVLSVDDGVGYLANAATLPACRRRGVQGALIRRRVTDAIELGATTIASLATEGSDSQRNLERSGLAQVGTHVVWRMA